MFSIKNYISVAIFLVLFFLAYISDSFSKINTSLDTIMVGGEKKELLERFNEFGFSKKLLVFVDGVDAKSLQKIKLIDEILLKNSSITLVKNSSSFSEYQKEYIVFSYPQIFIKDELEKLKQNILNAEFSYFVDPKDPLALAKKQNTSLSLKNNHLATKDGYISIFELDTTNKERLYEEIELALDGIDGVKVFSPFFYFVENQKMIKDDANRIIYIATAILILLYMVLLRDTKLLFHTLLTLASSILFALILTSFIFQKVAIFALVFGLSISSVAIDYMFHHYVHGRYDKNKGFSKDVFFGMLTTSGAFFILSNVSFELIKQFSYFTIFSLTFSYVVFAFIFPIIGFSYHNKTFVEFKSLSLVKPKTVVFFAFIVIFIVFYNFKFDINIKNLDIKNERLDTLREFFVDRIGGGDSVICLLRASSALELVQNAKKIQAQGIEIPLAQLLTKEEFLQKRELILNFKHMLKQEAKEFGFRDGYFDDAYEPQEPPKIDKALLSSLGFEVLEFKNELITYVQIPKNSLSNLKRFDFIEDLRVKSLFESSLEELKNSLLLYGGVSILFIVGIVFLAYRQNLYTYLSFLFFPFSMILSINLFSELNILHIFILFIILSISIDYGIYISSKEQDINTKKAIIYSISTTFAGFGVLIFSSVNALFFIGLAASVGVLSILFLLFFLRVSSNEIKSF